MPGPPRDRWHDFISVEDEAVNAIGGTATFAVRKEVLQVFIGVTALQGVFASTFGHCVRIARVDVDPSPHQPSRVVGQVISEIVVGHDMVDEVGNVTVASIALLVDMLTSLCLVAQGAYQKRTGDYVGVSQSLQFVFHAPAPLGTTLRISNTCISLGARAMSARCEVWDANADRLVCSAFHVKMAPSASKL